MLYSTLRFLFTLTVKGYFRSLSIKGKDNIPDSGPVIFAPNHPSAFMDPILLSTQINRKLYFLARGDIFKSKLAAAFFQLIHMIPVFRKGETQGHDQKNDQIFRKCFDHLAKGKPIMIFPEGLSKTERRLRPIKTGAARIALGAEFLHHFALGVKIVPVGINYSNPHSFRSDVFINFGVPIEASAFREIFLKDDREGVHALTERIKTEMEKLLVIVQDEQLEGLVGQIETIYRSTLRKDAEIAEKGIQDFHLSRDIILALDYHMKHHPERVVAFKKKMDTYMNALAELNLRDSQVRASKLNVNVLQSILFFLLGFPIFLFGLITNSLPYLLAGKITNLVPLREDFVGSIKIAVGMLVFLLMYVVESAVVANLTHVWLAILFLISLYPAGVFTLSYLKRYYLMADTWKYLRLFMEKSDLIAKLKMTRQELIDDLESGRIAFLANVVE